jgi:hypothetical protein
MVSEHTNLSTTEDDLRIESDWVNFEIYKHQSI